MSFFGGYDPWAAPVRRSNHYTPPLRVEVTERRAPTDESVRLLKEMEDAARTKVIQSFPIEHNGFTARVLVEEYVIPPCRRATALFDLSGTTFEVSVTADIVELYRDPNALWFKLRDAMAKELASEILIPALEQVPTTPSLHPFFKG